MDLNKHRASAYLKGAGKAAPKDSGLVKKVGADSSPPAQAKAPPPPATGDRAPAKGGKPSRNEIAKYLILIGHDEATKVLKHLGEQEVEDLAREIASIERVDADEAKVILDRFRGLVRGSPGGPATGGASVAKEILLAAFGEEKGKQLFHQALPEAEQPFFAYLMDLDPSHIHSILKPESAAVKSIVLAYLPPPSAAAIIKACSAAEQKDIIVRMAAMKRIDKDVLVRIDTALRDRVRQAASVVKDEIDGRASLVNIMRHLDPQLEQGLLDELGAQAPDLAQEIRDRLFTIDTVLLIDDRDLQRVLTELDDKVLAMLLKGKSEEIRAKLMKNMSDSRARLVAEEYQLLGPQLRRDVDEVTRNFIQMLKTRENEGTLRVWREEDQYV